MPKQTLARLLDMCDLVPARSPHLSAAMSEHRFCRENLKIHEKFVGPQGLSTPTLMVINTADQIASFASLIPFTEKMTTKTQIIHHRTADQNRQLYLRRVTVTPGPTIV